MTCPRGSGRRRCEIGGTVWGIGMASRHHKPEQIVVKLRRVEVLTGQVKILAEAVRSIGVTEATYYRWRAEYGGLKLDQVRRLKQLEQENSCLRRAVSDLTLQMLLLKQAALGDW